jgi:imidazolonepropionase-like amidohydrolase
MGALLVAFLALAAPERVAIRGARVHPVAAPPLPVATVLVEDGKIVAVGRDLPIPAGAQVIEGEGKTLIPGLVAAYTTLASGAEDDRDTVASDVRAVDGLDLLAENRALLAGGVTCFYATPGSRRLVSGLGAVAKTAGSARLLREQAGLRVALGESSKNPPHLFEPPIPPSGEDPILPVTRQWPSSRMSARMMLDRLFLEATTYRDAWARHYVSGEKAPPRNRRLEGLAAALRGELPVRVLARSARDLQTALELADRFHWKLVLEEATEGALVADDIARRGASAVVHAPYRPNRAYRGDDTRDAQEGRPDPALAAALARRGIPVAITAPTDAELPDLLYLAACAVRHGLRPDEALAAITSRAAAILGVADRVGTIEAGKDADLVLLSRDPFDVRALPEVVLVDGRVVWRRPADELPSSSLLVRAGRIVTGAGADVLNGSILVEGGRIGAIGGKLAAPGAAQVLDAPEGVVIAGPIDALCHLGFHRDQIEDAPAQAPAQAPLPIPFPVPGVVPGPGAQGGGGPAAPGADFRAADCVVPLDEGFLEVLPYGVTGALVAPAGSGGQAALLRLSGETRESLVLRAPAGLRFTLESGARSRVRQAETVRTALRAGKQYSDQWEKYEKDKKEAEGKPDAKPPEEPRRVAAQEPYRALFRKEIAALVDVRRADEIEHALKLFHQEFPVNLVLLGAEDAWRMPAEIKKAGALVVVGPEVVRRVDGRLVNLPRVLADAGVRVAFRSDGTSGAKMLLHTAAYAVRHGMDPTAALLALTRHAAEAYGVADRLGTIEPGKDADFVVLSGDPFDPGTRVRAVVSAGRVVFRED